MGLDHDDDDMRKQDLFETVASLVERLTVSGKGQELREIRHDDDNHFDDKKGNGHHEKPKLRQDSEHSNEETDGIKVVDEIESLCMKCHENGTTRLFLTKIPYFREIVLMSFYCEHCYFKNTEIQSASEIQEKGVQFRFTLDHPKDLERQVVKSDTAILRIEDLDLEIPAGLGKLTNIEGVLEDILGDLKYGQKTRQEEDPELFSKIDTIIQSLVKMMLGTSFPIAITLDDPAGNSWIEPSTDHAGQKYIRADYARTFAQNEALGLHEGQGIETESGEMNSLETTNDSTDLEDIDIQSGLIYSLPCECPGCSKTVTLKIQMVDIPHFKQVIISAANCDACGYRTNDVKTGGEVPNKGQRIWLHIQGPKDLSRDILKSETCLLTVPECNVEVVPGTMAGRFTTVEGLLTQIRDDLRGSLFDVGDTDGTTSDSMPQEKKNAWKAFFDKLEMAIKGEFEYTIMLQDPLANSYAQSFLAPQPDPQIVTEEYERTADEEEELGLNDIKTQMNDKGEYVKEEADVEDAKKD